MVAEQPENWELRVDGSYAGVKAFELLFFFHKAFVSSVENLHKNTTDLVNNCLLKISIILAVLVIEGKSLATVK